MRNCQSRLPNKLIKAIQGLLPNHLRIHSQKVHHNQQKSKTSVLVAHIDQIPTAKVTALWELAASLNAACLKTNKSPMTTTFQVFHQPTATYTGIWAVIKLSTGNDHVPTTGTKVIVSKIAATQFYKDGHHYWLYPCGYRPTCSNDALLFPVSMLKSDK